MNKRVDNIEFRWGEHNNSYELIRWFTPEGGKEYCIVIAFFRKDSEGYDMETVGRRYLDCIDSCGSKLVIEMTRFAFDFLRAEFTLEEELKYENQEI